MSGNYVIDSDENSDYMYNIIKDILEEVGPRAPCSAEERKASEMMAKELEDKCDNVEIEDFQIYPRALHGWVNRILDILITTLKFPYHIFNYLRNHFICTLHDIQASLSLRRIYNEILASLQKRELSKCCWNF